MKERVETTGDELADHDRALIETRLDNERLTSRLEAERGDMERLRCQLDAARRETKRLSASAADLETEVARAKARSERAAEELRKVQGHLTALLSGRLLRSTRPFRRLWHRLRSKWQI